MTLIPVGGLANRMRAIAGALTLAQQSAGGRLRVIWFSTWGMRAPFSSLFQPADLPGLTIDDGTLLHKATLDRPRKRNLWIPRIYQQLAFDFRLYENDALALRNDAPTIQRIVDAQRPYVASFNDLAPYSDDLLRQLFQPLPVVMQEIERRVARFAPYTVGVHVRRTDNTECIERSPIELFFAALDAELNEHADLGIYLATDSEEVKAQMRQRYGERIITATSVADRDSVEGIRDGIADMYTLARTQRIYGSAGSSFSPMAARLGGIPLISCQSV